MGPAVCVGVCVCRRCPPSTQQPDMLAVLWAPQFTRGALFSICPAAACLSTAFSTGKSTVAP